MYANVCCSEGQKSKKRLLGSIQIRTGGKQRSILNTPDHRNKKRKKEKNHNLTLDFYSRENNISIEK